MHAHLQADEAETVVSRELTLAFDAGTTWKKTTTWTGPDGTTPIDWTGYTAAWQFSSTSKFGDDVFYTASGAALTLTSGGVMTLRIPNATRDAWPPVIVHHHLNVTLPGGDVERWLEGRVRVDD
jgi:hypothetical protein